MHRILDPVPDPAGFSRFWVDPGSGRIQDELPDPPDRDLYTCKQFISLLYSMYNVYLYIRTPLVQKLFKYQYYFSRVQILFNTNDTG